MNSRTLKSISPYLPKLASEVRRLSVSKTPKLSKPLKQAIYEYTLATLPYRKPTTAEEIIFEDGREAWEERREEFLALAEFRNELGDLHKA